MRLLGRSCGVLGRSWGVLQAVGLSVAVAAYRSGWLYCRRGSDQAEERRRRERRGEQRRGEEQGGGTEENLTTSTVTLENKSKQMQNRQNKKEQNKKHKKQTKDNTQGKKQLLQKRTSNQRSHPV